MNSPLLSGVAYCVGCGCHDLAACECGCHWLRVDYQAARGVCSECRKDVRRWDAGDRALRVPITENLMVIGQAVHTASSKSGKGPEAAAYVAGMIDILHWLGELTVEQRVEIFALAGREEGAPPVPGWIAEN